MTPVERIKLYEAEFTNSDLKIQKYLEHSLSDVSSYSITEISDRAGVSKSAFLRFCQKIGYDGFAEFKYDVSRFLLSGFDYDSKNLCSLASIIRIYSDGISSLSDSISSSTLEKITSLILDSSRIRIYGIHESGLSATYMSYRLSTLGIDSESISSAALFHSKISCAKKQDLNIFFSVSGANQETSEAFHNAFQTPATNILITSNAHTKGAKNFDCILVLPSINSNSQRLFLDSHSMVIIGIDIIINELAKVMNKK